MNLLWKRLLTPDKAFAPAVLQSLGIILILVAVVALAIGQSWGAALLGTGGSLLGIGEYAAAAGKMTELQQHFARLEQQHPLLTPPQKHNAGETTKGDRAS